jgi:hypothetical protein
MTLTPETSKLVVIVESASAIDNNIFLAICAGDEVGFGQFDCAPRLW